MRRPVPIAFVSGRAAALVLLAAVACLSLISPGRARAADPAQADSALGIPCVPANGVRFCPGSLTNRVPTWDGVPLDSDVYLPPAGTPGPYPLIVALHGFGANKSAAFENPSEAFALARQGYAVLAYSARGLGLSCGLVVSRTPGGCDRGWIHLADARYEGRDTQYLAGLLVDEGLVKPQRIGVTGTSYGGGQSMMLAALRDRMMLPSGRLVPFTSPRGTRMRIAAAAPKIGWSDLAYALVPSGRTLDYRAANPYGRGAGIPKYSYLQGLFAAGLPGYYAPPGADPEADIINWKAEIDGGEPYDRAVFHRIRAQFMKYRSAYYLQRHLPARRRQAPAPLVIYNGWTDDIMPASEALRFYNRTKQQFPRASVGLVFADELAHPRGSLATEATLLNRARAVLFDRYLMGNRTAKPLVGALTATQACGGSPRLGPFRTRSWRRQHPGEVRLRHRRPKTFDSAGGSPGLASQTDPFAGGGACRIVKAQDDPGAATYLTAAAKGEGWTMIGSPTITARIKVRGKYPQIEARLWDVGPDGRQAFVQHSIYKPRTSGRQTFQLNPSGWHFATGHRAKLELLGRDYPYAQASNGTFEITVRRLKLRLPVRQRPDGAQISRYEVPGPTARHRRGG